MFKLDNFKNASYNNYRLNYKEIVMRKYYSYLLKKALHIKKFLAVDYIEITPSYHFSEEGHFFYEFAYVDSGTVGVNIGDAEYTLKQGDAILIEPDVHHNYFFTDKGNGSTFIVCFEASCVFLKLLEGQLELSPTERALVSLIYTEAKNAFKFPRVKKLTLLSTPLFGAQDLVENNLENLLIMLIRKKLNSNTEIKFVMNSADFSDKLVDDIIKILKANVYNKISLEAIQNQLYYSKTYLNNNFKKTTGDSIMHYYKTLKIEEAKKLIKNGDSVATISDKLHFENPNYFSKVFKAVTGFTPSHYKKTI